MPPHAMTAPKRSPTEWNAHGAPWHSWSEERSNKLKRSLAFGQARAVAKLVAGKREQSFRPTKRAHGKGSSNDASRNAYELALWKRHERTFRKHSLSADDLARSRTPASNDDLARSRASASTHLEHSGDRRAPISVTSKAGRATHMKLRRCAEACVAFISFLVAAIMSLVISFLVAALVGLSFGACIYIYTH
jgi:hypothetical protein